MSAPPLALPDGPLTVADLGAWSEDDARPNRVDTSRQRAERRLNNALRAALAMRLS
jgi:hypothetical protein